MNISRLISRATTYLCNATDQALYIHEHGKSRDQRLSQAYSLEDPFPCPMPGKSLSSPSNLSFPWQLKGSPRLHFPTSLCNTMPYHFLNILSRSTSGCPFPKSISHSPHKAISQKSSPRFLVSPLHFHPSVPLTLHETFQLHTTPCHTFLTRSLSKTYTSYTNRRPFSSPAVPCSLINCSNQHNLAHSPHSTPCPHKVNSIIPFIHLTIITVVLQ